MPLRFRDWLERIRERRRQSVREARTASAALLLDFGAAGGIAVGVALLFVILSPAATDRLSAGVRLVYWLTVLVGGSAIGAVLGRILYRQPQFARRPLLGSLATGALLTPPISLLVALANRFAFGYPVASAEHWLAIAPSVFGLSCGLSLVNLWATTGDRRPRPESADTRPEDVLDRFEPRAGVGLADEGEALFRARLPDGFKTAELWAIEAEDHYLRIHTGAGRTLVLMRLSDAVTALAGLDGAQTHRSWWVARSAARRIETAQGRAVLALPDGTRAPVSRSFYRSLKDRGWL